MFPTMILTVVIEEAGPGQFRATTSQPLPLSAVADTANAAITRLKEEVERKLSQCEIVQLEVSGPTDNPWKSFAGIWKENPDFDAFRENVAAYRADVNESER